MEGGGLIKMYVVCVKNNMIYSYYKNIVENHVYVAEINEEKKIVSLVDEDMFKWNGYLDFPKLGFYDIKNGLHFEEYTPFKYGDIVTESKSNDNDVFKVLAFNHNFNKFKSCYYKVQSLKNKEIHYIQDMNNIKLIKDAKELLQSLPNGTVVSTNIGGRRYVKYNNWICMPEILGVENRHCTWDKEQIDISGFDEGLIHTSFKNKEGQHIRIESIYIIDTDQNFHNYKIWNHESIKTDKIKNINPVILRDENNEYSFEILKIVPNYNESNDSFELMLTSSYHEQAMYVGKMPQLHELKNIVDTIIELNKNK